MTSSPRRGADRIIRLLRRGTAPQLALSGEVDEQTLHQVVRGSTSIDITPVRPRELRLPQGEATVSALHVSVDDVGAFLAAARTHLR